MFKKIIFLLIFITFSHTQLLDRINSNAFKSLLIPGLGEYSLDKKEHSKKFFIAETFLWLSFLGSQKGYSWYKDDYMMFGSYHADIDLNAIPDYKLSKLIVHMSQYDNMEEFNETMDRQRRDNSYTNSEIYEWNWDSDDNRNKFNEIRIKSSNLKQINNFTISALLINRLISFFNTIYLSDKKYNLNSSIYPLKDDGLIFYFNINF